MKKSTLLPAIVFLILAGGLFMLLTNSHVDVFSGSENEHDYFTQTDGWKEKSVSLLAVSRGDAKLDTMGWLTAAGVIGGFPLLISFLIRRRLVKKEKKSVSSTETNS
jgi:hypothetical protein